MLCKHTYIQTYMSLKLHYFAPSKFFVLLRMYHQTFFIRKGVVRKNSIASFHNFVHLKLDTDFFFYSYIFNKMLLINFLSISVVNFNLITYEKTEVFLCLPSIFCLSHYFILNKKLSSKKVTLFVRLHFLLFLYKLPTPFLSFSSRTLVQDKIINFYSLLFMYRLLKIYSF